MPAFGRPANLTDDELMAHNLEDAAVSLDDGLVHD
jgi:hypothetical protein